MLCYDSAYWKITINIPSIRVNILYRIVCTIRIRRYFWIFIQQWVGRKPDGICCLSMGHRQQCFQQTYPQVGFVLVVYLSWQQVKWCPMKNLVRISLLTMPRKSTSDVMSPVQKSHRESVHWHSSKYRGRVII